MALLIQNGGPGAGEGGQTLGLHHRGHPCRRRLDQPVKVLTVPDPISRPLSRLEQFHFNVSKMAVKVDSHKGYLLPTQTAARTERQ